jgi:RHH-type proline utilization regulon transcriptional repressor/proline dehydrogenase/delta 1-pyrroline-5-carboxylate dehydrogenase
MPLFSRKKSPALPERTAADGRATNGSAAAIAEPTKRPPASSTANATAADAARSTRDDGGRWRDQRIYELGKELLERAKQNKAGMFSKAFWSDKLMDWSMKDHDFKVQLFRFVDTFPVLRTPDAIYEHLIDYMNQPGVTTPPGMSTMLKAGGMAKGMTAKTMSGQITNMAKTFIAGTDAQSALPNLKKLWDAGIAFSVDLLGEVCVSDAEADMYRDKYLDLVRNLPEAVAGWPTNDRLETGHLGPIPRTNVSIKISALSAKADAIDTEGAIRDIMTRVVPILEEAKQRGVFINFDMEHFAIKDLTLELFMRCCEEVDFEAGLAMQAYLKSGDDDARRIAQWSKRAGRHVTVRLVKGAYWDAETIHAEQEGWPCPVWNTKSETDACFERMSEIFLDATPRNVGDGGVTLALGSHNARSIGAALDGLERRDLPRSAIELQMLHGMADQLKAAAVEMGLRTREYVPVGEMIPGMAYLVRRLLENTSNESWLKAGFLEAADLDELLASPHGRGGGITDLAERGAERHQLSPAVDGVGDGKPFITEPIRDFAHAPVRERFAAAIASAEVPRVANDNTPDDASAAIGAAHAFFPTWRDTDPRERANVLTRAADLMRRRRDEISGIVLKENGKGWRDADADVTEAIDFMEYYARHAVPLFERERLGRFIGELDQTLHQPRGVAGVISPWNFPLAISTGMTTAALVTGNTVVLKPAEQTPGIAKVLVDTLHDAGAPRDALHFLPGPGETTGAAIVRDPRVSLLCFTGSKAVGLDIINAAGETTPEQEMFAAQFGGVKKVVCEMGGKNAIIVDTSADLDEAVLGVRKSAFGFQGQKCSACSRVIVVDPHGAEGEAFRVFMERLVESTRSLVIDNPIQPGSDVGPVIDSEAAERIRSMIDAGKQGGAEVALEMRPPDDLDTTGCLASEYVGPVIFSKVTPSMRIWREEIFGPVLSVAVATSFDDALDLANDCPYKLTGGVYSRKPAHLERAKERFRVGNLYLNRNITGALVGRQPFGGFGMSGVGSKAGGSEYLLQFVEPRAICENTMRRGFAPEL